MVTPLSVSADKCLGSCRMKRDYRRSRRGRKRSSLAQQLRQLGDVGGEAPGATVRPVLQLALSLAALCREMPQNQPISLHRVTSH